jgi:hypothetical protein
VTLCSLVDGCYHFGGTPCFHLHDQSVQTEDIVRLCRQVTWNTVSQIPGQGKEDGTQFTQSRPAASIIRVVYPEYGGSRFL